MTKTFTPPDGKPKYITDFLPEAALWNATLGHCFKANTADGLVVVQVSTGTRFEVASTEMFYAAEIVAAPSQPKTPNMSPTKADIQMQTGEETLSDGSKGYNLYLNDICIPCLSREAAMTAGLTIAKAIRQCSNLTVSDWLV